MTRECRRLVAYPPTRLPLTRLRIPSCRRFQIAGSQYACRYGDATSTLRENRWHVVGGNASYGDRRLPSGLPQEPAESLRTEACTRVLCRGRAPRPDPPVIGSPGRRCLLIASHRGTDQKPSRCDAPSEVYRQVVGPEVNACSLGGNGHIRPIIHQNWHPKHSSQRSYSLDELARVSPL